MEERTVESILEKQEPIMEKKEIQKRWSLCWAIAKDRSEDVEKDELLDALEKLWDILGLKVLG